ncbi:hypothetical protein BOTBODRAFT_48220 [Botryobasidium botryosum FD-172 SS1]|uniref:Uncharacterized protein n=1 Tax=Botryobasidium botryosum (strain FD-172 SS1) TaxID=930990 RepID=A0A067LYL4_BOTB1|nr:hypothetical protein BOTBODRAFT_48220 [Botryobasidium botryosum FD-172 SS1]
MAAELGLLLVLFVQRPIHAEDSTGASRRTAFGMVKSPQAVAWPRIAQLVCLGRRLASNHSIGRIRLCPPGIALLDCDSGGLSQDYDDGRERRGDWAAERVEKRLPQVVPTVVNATHGRKMLWLFEAFPVGEEDQPAQTFEARGKGLREALAVTGLVALRQRRWRWRTHKNDPGLHRLALIAEGHADVPPLTVRMCVHEGEVVAGGLAGERSAPGWIAEKHTNRKWDPVTATTAGAVKHLSQRNGFEVDAADRVSDVFHAYAIAATASGAKENEAVVITMAADLYWASVAQYIQGEQAQGARTEASPGSLLSTGMGTSSEFHIDAGMGRAPSLSTTISADFPWTDRRFSFARGGIPSTWRDARAYRAAIVAMTVRVEARSCTTPPSMAPRTKSLAQLWDKAEWNLGDDEYYTDLLEPQYRIVNDVGRNCSHLQEISNNKRRHIANFPSRYTKPVRFFLYQYRARVLAMQLDWDGIHASFKEHEDAIANWELSNLHAILYMKAVLAQVIKQARKFGTSPTSFIDNAEKTRRLPTLDDWLRQEAAEMHDPREDFAARLAEVPMDALEIDWITWVRGSRLRQLLYGPVSLVGGAYVDATDDGSEAPPDGFKAYVALEILKICTGGRDEVCELSQQELARSHLPPLPERTPSPEPAEVVRATNPQVASTTTSPSRQGEASPVLTYRKKRVVDIVDDSQVDIVAGVQADTNNFDAQDEGEDEARGPDGEMDVDGPEENVFAPNSAMDVEVGEDTQSQSEPHVPSDMNISSRSPSPPGPPPSPPPAELSSQPSTSALPPDAVPPPLPAEPRRRLAYASQARCVKSTVDPKDTLDPALEKFFGHPSGPDAEEDQDAGTKNMASSTRGTSELAAVVPSVGTICITGWGEFKEMIGLRPPVPSLARFTMADDFGVTEAVSFWLVEAFGDERDKVVPYEQTIASLVAQLPLYIQKTRDAFDRNEGSLRCNLVQSQADAQPGSSHRRPNMNASDGRLLKETIQTWTTRALVTNMTNLQALAGHIQASKRGPSFTKAKYLLCKTSVYRCIEVFVELHDRRIADGT